MSDQPDLEDWKTVARLGESRRRLAEGKAPSVELPRALYEQVVEAARDDAPNETVGLLVAPAYAANGGVASRYARLRNAAASPYRYLLDPDEQFQLLLEIDDADEVVWAIVHSHVASPAVPSVTDVGLAFYPDSLYLICTLAEDPPVIRGWTIRDGVVAEVELRLT